MDPLMAFNFRVSLIDSTSGMVAGDSLDIPGIVERAVGGFSECDGLEMTLDVEDWEEGGRNGAVLHFPSRVKWANLTLKKGIGLSTDLWDWHFGFAEGRGRRRDGFVALLDEGGAPSSVWYFRRGLPVKYTGPTLNATDNAVAIETIEISHEGIHQLSNLGLGTAAVEGLVP